MEAKTINYVGYYCLGASDSFEATNEQGLCVWMTKRPKLLKRIMIHYLFGAIWIDRFKTKIIKPRI